MPRVTEESRATSVAEDEDSPVQLDWEHLLGPVLFSFTQLESVAAPPPPASKFLFKVPLLLLLLLVQLLIVLPLQLELLLLEWVKPKFVCPWLLLLTDVDTELVVVEVEFWAAGALKDPEEVFKVAVGLLLFTEFPVVDAAPAPAAPAVAGFVVLVVFALCLRKSLRSPNIPPPVQVPPIERISLSSVRNPLK